MTHMIGSRMLDKPAVGVSHTDGKVKIVGERIAVMIPMPHDSLSEVRHMNHWCYHDILYHDNKDHPGEQTCDVCNEFGETDL